MAITKADLVLVSASWDAEGGASVEVLPIVGWNEELEPIVLSHGVLTAFGAYAGGDKLGQVTDESGVVSLHRVAVEAGSEAAASLALSRVEEYVAAKAARRAA